MAVGFGARAKAAAYVAAISLAIGSDPIVEETPGYIRIRFTTEQKKALQEFIEGQLKKGPGDVRVEIGPVLTPIILKRLIPFSLATLAGSWFLRRRATA